MVSLVCCRSCRSPPPPRRQMTRQSLCYPIAMNLFQCKIKFKIGSSNIFFDILFFSKIELQHQRHQHYFPPFSLKTHTVFLVISVTRQRHARTVNQPHASTQTQATRRTRYSSTCATKRSSDIDAANHSTNRSCRRRRAGTWLQRSAGDRL